MKRFITALFAAMISTSTAFATMLAYNTEEYRLQGNLDFDSAAGTEFEIEVGYGYFVADYVQVGGLVSYLNNDIITSGSGGVFSEYNFETETSLIPFVGTQVRYIYASIDIAGSDESTDALAGGIYGGLKYFIYDNLAVSLRLLFEAATDDVYAEDDDINDTDLGIDFGLRMYF